MQIKNQIIILFSLITVLGTSCTKDKLPCVNASGTIETQYRSVSGYTGIVNSMEANIYLTEGAEFEFRIEAPAHVQYEIKTSISNSVVEIYSEHCINSDENVKIYFTMPLIQSIEISGSGAVYTQNRVETCQLSIDVSGSGSFYAKDYIMSTTLEIFISGLQGSNI